MVQYYNISLMQNASGMLDLAHGADSMLGGFFFGWFILIIIAFVTFVTLKSKDYTTSSCFTATSWFIMFVAWLLRTMSLIDNYTLWATVILTIISVFVLFLSNN